MDAAGKFIVGRQLLDVITSGMYDNPLMVYREYIQNAVDSIDRVAVDDQQDLDDCDIQIKIDGQNRTVVIEDTGAGLPEDAAEQILLSLGFSPKEDGGFRGFRGIGRLGGLGYCDTLKFETRASSVDRVTEVVWNRLRLDALIERKDRISLEEALHEIVETRCRCAGKNDPDRFFRVTMENVHRFYSDHIMQVSKVRDYLAQVAPVPFPSKFSMGDTIEKHLAGVPGYRSYDIFVNGLQIYRSYEDVIRFSEKHEDRIDEIQTFEINGERNEIIAKGWIAKLKYYGSLPAQNSMRGIRIRQGNIEIGGEYCLAEHFSESRFATWQVGEIHVVMNALKANARRDGFENSLNYEKLLEFSSRIGKHLSKACRQESRNRNNYAKAINCIARIKEDLQDNSIYIDAKHFEQAKKCIIEDLDNIKNDAAKNGASKIITSEIAEIETLIQNGDHKVNFLVDMVNFAHFNNKSGKKAFVDFVKCLIQHKGPGKEVDRVLMKSLSSYFKSNFTENDELAFRSVGI